MARERIRTTYRGGRLGWYEATIAEKAGKLSHNPRKLLRNGVIIILTTATVGFGLGLAAARRDNTPPSVPNDKPPAVTPDTTNKPIPLTH